MSALAKEVILNSQNSPVYTQRFGLSRDPFYDDGVEGLFYPGAERRECLDRLLHLSRYGHYLVHVIGEKGVGKSLLSQTFASRAADYACTASHIDTPVMMGPDQMMRKIAQGFGLALSGNETAAQIIENLFVLARTKVEQGVELVAIIDDAHQLAEESLALIVALAHQVREQRIGFHLVLFAEPQFNKLLVKPEIKDGFEKLSYGLQLKQFSQSESREYINYRLKTAGYTGSFPLSEKQMRSLQQQSRGVAARINQLSSQALLQAAIEPPNRVIGLPPLHMTAVLVLGVLLVALVLWQKSEELNLATELPQQTQSPEKMEQAQSSEVETETEPGAAFLSKSKLDDPQLNNLANGTQAQNQEPIATVAELRKQVKQELHAGQLEQPVEELFVAGPKSENAPELAADGANRNIQTFAAQTNTAQINTAQKALLAKPSLTSAAESQAQPQSQPQSQQRAPAPPAQQRTQASNNIANTGGAAKLRPARGYFEEAWLLTRDPEHYTLQLLGAHNYDAVKSFIQQNKQASADGLAQFSTSRQGERWYVVVYGDYATREQAVQAIANIPQSLQDLKPWARSFASVQNDIKSRR